MLRAHRAMLILVPALLAGYTACGVQPASEEDSAAVTADMRVEPKIIGTFRDEGATAGIAVLTLKTDWTFHMERAIQCIRFPCNRPEINGVYKYGQHDGYNVLMLFEGVRQTTMGGTYLKYLFRNDVLWVAPAVRDGLWQPLPRSEDAWCDMPKDCTLQDLEGSPCAGFWYCGANVCDYACRPVPCTDGFCPGQAALWTEPEVVMSTQPTTEPRTEPKFVGTFRDEQAWTGIAVLTLKTDWTFHLEEGVQCIKAPCIGPEKNGSYQYGQIGGYNVLVLTENIRDTATLPTYLRYILKGDVLYVESVARNSTWQALARSEDAWCGVPKDCSQQGLVPLTCLGQWVCASNVCDYACGPVACEVDGTC